MKHFGAALASYGSVALFHMIGITPEAQRLDDVRAGRRRCARMTSARPISARSRRAMRKAIDSVDLVVFSAPQLSLIEMQQVAELLDGRRATIPLLVGHQPAGQAGRRPHGADRADRGGRRHGAVRHVLLPELRARDGGGERLEAARHQLGQAHQHPRRLWLQAGAAVDGGLRRRRLRGRQARDEHRSSTPRPAWAARCRARRWSPRTASRRATISTASRACSRGPSTSSRARATSAACWCSMPPRAASPPPGCCTRCRRAA